MISWVTRQYKMPLKWLRQAKFNNRSYYYSGRACLGSRSILVKVDATNARFPVRVKYPKRKKAPEYTFEDWVEALVAVTAHEICHIDEYVQNRKRPLSETRTEHYTLRLLLKFRADRENLLAAWGFVDPSKKPVVVEAPVVIERVAANSPDFMQKRAEHAASMKLRWEKKLKLAKTKVKKWQAVVKRYQKRGLIPL